MRNFIFKTQLPTPEYHRNMSTTFEFLANTRTYTTHTHTHSRIPSTSRNLLCINSNMQAIINDAER